MNLADAVQKLNETEEFLKTDPDSYPWQTRNGLLTKRRAVEQEVAGLRDQVRALLQDANGAVCFVGPADRLLAEARKKGAVVAVDASVPYREITAAVDKTLHRGNREWTATQMSAVATEILTRMADIDPYNRPDLTTPANLQPFVVGNPEELVAVVRRQVREMFGDRLVGEYISRELLAGALKHDLAKRVPQLIVYGVGNLAEAEGLRAFWPFAAVVDPKNIKQNTK